MKVFVSRKIPQMGIDLLLHEGISPVIWNEDRLMTQGELIENAKKTDALLCMSSDKIDKFFLNACKHLKVISQYSVGYDNVDVAESIALGIPIGNTPDVLSDATADVAFTLMLSVARRAFYMHKKIINGEWSFSRPTVNLGIELKNKTLGIFGLGRIGLEMAKRCKGAYNMNIIYCSPSSKPVAEDELKAKRVSFDELLLQSDIVSVHCTLTAETKEKFDLSAFRKMKKTAIFINTARGIIHNELDLIEALQRGIIWGAGLDVTSPEPMRSDNPLLFMDNAAILPHIGSSTVEARNAMAKLAAENIISGLRGEELPHLVNKGVYNI